MAHIINSWAGLRNQFVLSLTILPGRVMVQTSGSHVYIQPSNRHLILSGCPSHAPDRHTYLDCQVHIALVFLQRPTEPGKISLDGPLQLSVS